MKHVGRSLSDVPAAVFLLWASVAALAPAASGQTTGSIVGRVTDSSGSSLSGVTVEATDMILQSTSVATTGADGRFWFPAMPAGVYEVSAKLSGFRPGNKFVTVSLERDTAVSFSLKPAVQESVAVSKVVPLVDTPPPPVPTVAAAKTTGSIVGRVTDSSGSPLPGVTIEAASPSLQSTLVAATGTDGRFWFPVMPPGAYEVRAKLSRFQPGKKSVTVSLDKGTTIAFSLDPVAETVAASALAPSIEKPPAPAPTPAPVPATTVAAAKTTGSIVGRVTDSSGSSLPGVTIEATSPSLQGTLVATTGTDGSFRFPAMPAGAYEVRAKLSRFQPGKKSVKVSLNKGTTVAFSLERAVEESVAASTVVRPAAERAPVPAPTVAASTVVRPAAERAPVPAPTVAASTVVRPPVETAPVPAATVATAKTTGTVSAAKTTGSVAAAKTTASIAGRVTDSLGSSLPGVTIEATSPSLRGTLVATTGADGKFRFTAMPPGAYEVSAKLSGFRPGKKSVKVSLGAGTTASFSLEPAIEESVRVSALAPPIEKPPTPAPAPAPTPAPVPVTTTTVATAQSSPGFGRVSLFGQGLSSRSASGGSRQLFGSYWGAVTLRAPSSETGGFDYGFDVRAWDDTTPNSNPRVSAFEAFIGGRTKDNVLGLWAGQMWLSELGGLGSLGGLVVGASPKGAGPLGRFRFSLFSGVEPKILQVGYLRDIRKSGGFMSLDGARGRHHAIGYVLVKNNGLKERSVITTTNFVPIGSSFFLYQASEYDLIKPGGLGKSGLNYIFANMRIVPVRRVELQATYHHGLSIDARTLTDNQLNGRPIDPRLLDGFLFESFGGRLSVDVLPTVRVYAGYSRERGNNQDQKANRVTLGLYASNLLWSGFDLTVSDNRITHLGGTGDYDYWYGSLGHSVGRSVYLSVEYATSVSIVRFTDSGGVVVESQPKTRRYALSGVMHISRPISLLLTLEELRDDTTTQQRGLLGLTFRF